MLQNEVYSFSQFAKNEMGHSVAYQEALEHAFKKLGATFTVLLPEDSELNRLPENWVKTLPPIPSSNWRWKFFFKCIALFRKKPKGKRIIFLETHRKSDFPFFASAAYFFSRRHDHLMVVYRDDLQQRGAKEQNRITKWTLRLKRKFKDRFHLFTDSELIAEDNLKRFKTPLTVLPIPHIDFPVKRFAPLDHKKALVALFPSNPRPEKGLDTFIQLLKFKDPGADSMTLRFSKTIKCQDIATPAQLAPFKPHQTREGYLQLMDSCDLILLPYISQQYKRRSSGIFIEAILAGKIPLVTDGTWLSHHFKEFDLEKLIVDFNDPLFFTHAKQKLSDPKLILKLQKLQDALTEYHSLDNFTATLKKAYSFV